MRALERDKKEGREKPESSLRTAEAALPTDTNFRRLLDNCQAEKERAFRPLGSSPGGFQAPASELPGPSIRSIS
jgi:hypothetical protein